MDLTVQMWHFNSMHTKNSTEETVWMTLKIVGVFAENLLHEGVLCLSLGLEHVLAVVRIEEELTGLGVGNELNIVEVATDRRHVRLWVNIVEAAKFMEDLRGIGFEGEGVLELMRWST